MLLKLSMIIPLAVMMVSDWKTRTVNIVWPALLFVLAAVDSVVKNGAVTALAFTGINVAIIFLLAAGLYGYARLCGKRLGELIGLGDALFFIAIAPVFPPEDYIRAVIVMLLCSLALWAILRKKFSLDTIPLITFCGIPLIFIWTKQIPNNQNMIGVSLGLNIAR